MKFEIKANGTFEAQNLLDAFKKIGEYYTSLYSMEEPDEILLETGNIVIKPIEEDK
jgi:hypothetical protein